MSVILYTASVSSRRETKSNQDRVKNILETKKIEYVEKDIASDNVAKEEMKNICPNGMPPILAKKDGDNVEFLADYDAFDNANEDGAIKQLLKLE